MFEAVQHTLEVLHHSSLSRVDRVRLSRHVLSLLCLSVSILVVELSVVSLCLVDVRDLFLELVDVVFLGVEPVSVVVVLPFYQRESFVLGRQFVLVLLFLHAQVTDQLPFLL